MYVMTFKEPWLVGSKPKCEVTYQPNGAVIVGNPKNISAGENACVITGEALSRIESLHIPNMVSIGAPTSQKK